MAGLQAAFAVCLSTYEGKTAVRVDFFGTLDKFIHDNLVVSGDISFYSFHNMLQTNELSSLTSAFC